MENGGGEQRGCLGTSDLGLPLPAIEPVIQPFNNHSLHFLFELVVRTWEALLWKPREQAQPGHTIPSTPPYS